VRELSNERIDVFVWTDDIVMLAKKALAAAKVSNVYPVGDKKIVMVVPDEELAKAIGKDGSNIKLTSRFLDKEVLIYGEDEFDDFSEEEKAKIFTAKIEEIKKPKENIIDDDKGIEVYNENEPEDENSLSEQLVESGADLDDFAVRE